MAFSCLELKSNGDPTQNARHHFGKRMNPISARIVATMSRFERHGGTQAYTYRSLSRRLCKKHMFDEEMRGLPERQPPFGLFHLQHHQGRFSFHRKNEWAIARCLTRNLKGMQDAANLRPVQDRTALEAHQHTFIPHRPFVSESLFLAKRSSDRCKSRKSSMIRWFLILLQVKSSHENFD